MQSKNTKDTSTPKTKSTGLGDTVEKVFDATGIGAVAKFIMGEDCGCSDRREVLNKVFPYQKPNCLTEDEYNYLTKYFADNKNVLPADTQKQLVAIYNRVFNDKATTTSCSKCFLNSIHKKLERVYKEYK